MSTIQYKALISQLGIMEMMYNNHEPSADEVFDRAWFEKCMILFDYIKELEDQLADIANLSIKPMTQGGWTLEAFIKTLHAIQNKSA